MAKEFRLTEDHLTLLQNAYIRWEDAEYGAPGMDPKRPYGNSDVHGDIVEILQWEQYEYRSDEYDEQASEASDVHAGLETAMQIVLCHAGKATPAGLYRRSDDYKNDWERVGD